MWKNIIQTLIILTVFSILLTGCKQDDFVKTNMEFEKTYFELCQDVIKDTKEISQSKAFEMAERLQSDESATKLQKLQELLVIMKENESKKDSYSFVYKGQNDQYNRITAIKNSYNKWNQLSNDQKIEIAREYGIINVLYSMEVDEQEKKK